MKQKSVPQLALSYFGALAAATAVCLIFFASFSALFEYTVGRVVMQIIYLTVYSAFGYSVLWRRGDTDSNLVQFGHMEKDLFKGLRVGLLAYLPYLLLDLLLLLSKAGFFPNWLWIYKLLNTPYIVLLNLSLSTGDIAAHGYSDVLVGFLLHLYPIVLAAAAYIIGFHRISLMERIVFEKKRK